ncbi:MAG: LacI family DNA-binding transcriptional regulator [Egibacteraceae bacterium]
MRTTLRDIAAAAGVSEATVSRVVNGKPGVGEQTRAAVLLALREAGYEGVGAARLPERGLLGVIIPELDNPAFPLVAKAVEARLARAGHVTVIATSTLDGTSEQSYVEALLARGVGGFVFVSGQHADARGERGAYELLDRHGVPAVFVNGFMPGVDAPFLSTDDATATERAVAHLCALGHERIALLVGPGRYQPSHRKVAGYLRGLEACGGTGVAAQSRDLLVETSYTLEGGQAAMGPLLEQGVTGVVCGSDFIALGAVRAVRARGLDVPGDVSVVGFDDTPLMSLVDPPLTSLRQPLGELGTAAADALLAELAGEGAPHRGEHLFRAELIARGSTGPLRAPATPAP